MEEKMCIQENKNELISGRKLLSLRGMNELRFLRKSKAQRVRLASSLKTFI
jgi:hypothetical protein